MTRNTQKSNQFKKWIPFILSFAVGIGVMIGYQFNPNHESNFQLLSKLENKGEHVGQIGRVEEILRFVENSYVDTIDKERLLENAINDVLSELDPFSSYISPNELEEYNDQLDGVFNGIGINYIQFKDSIFITDIIDGSPADSADIKRGDVILFIDGDTISGLDIAMDVVREKIKDRKEVFKMGMVSGQTGKLEIKDLQVKKINIGTADITYFIKPDLVYLKIKRFSSNTYRQFVKSLEALALEQKTFDLVLDLRDNPGGYLPETIKILSQFIKEKQKILTYTEGSHRKRKDYKSTGQNFFDIDKIVVLINDNSASGSEIIAGALQDWDRALIVGETSYGKGLVQEVHELTNGGALRLTVARYMTPSGRSIQKPYRLQDSLLEVNQEFSYKSMKFNRELSGGGGISPDVEFADYNPYMDCEEFGFENIHSFILSSFPYASPFAAFEDFLNNFEVSNDDFLAYETFYTNLKLTGEEVEAVPPICFEAFEFLIKSILSKVWYSEIEHYKMINNLDPMVNEAVEIISENKLQALLSDKK